MQRLKLDPEMRTFLEAAGILHVTGVRQLSAEDVDHLLQSEVVRCVMTHCFDKGVEWLAPAERDNLWQQEIKPRLASPVNRPWDGWYDAREWRTDQHEPIIVFMHCYVPI